MRSIAVRRRLIPLVLLASSAFAPWTALATPLLTERFDYPDGNLVPHGDWSAHSSAGTLPIQVSGGRVFLHQGSGAREDGHRTFADPASSGKVYASFTLQVTATSPGPAVYFAHFRNANSLDFRSRIYVTSVAGGDYTLGLSASVQTSTPVITWLEPLQFGRTYRIVHSYDDATRISELWVDPTSESSPSITSTGFFVPSLPMDSYALRQGGSSPGEPSHASDEIIDSLIVATTFDEALGRRLSPDLALQFKCVTDSLGYYCVDHVFPRQPWGVSFGVLNIGQSTASVWSYAIDLVDASSGQRIPLATQVDNPPLPVGTFAPVHWDSPYLFDPSQEGTSWHVEVNVAVKDSVNSEPPDRQGNNQATWDVTVRNPVSDLALSFKCVNDSLVGCTNRIFPGQPWNVSFTVYNAGERRVNQWSYDIDLVDLDRGDRTPLFHEARHDSIPIGDFRAVVWPSTRIFDDGEKGGHWRVETRVTVEDAKGPEPPERQNNNAANWDFVVEHPVSDIAVYSKCVFDSAGSNCQYRVFPGQHWDVYFTVQNMGERPLAKWSYDIDLIQLATGDTTHLARGVPGDSLGRGGFPTSFRWPSPYVYDESQKGGEWQVDVTATVTDSLHPEPPDRQYNNRASSTFRVENPVVDLAAGFKCVTDSIGNCTGRILPGQTWYVQFDAHNSGERPIQSWGYTVDLVDLGTGNRTTLRTEDHLPAIPQGMSSRVGWPSPYSFSQIQKGSNWRVEVSLAVTDSAHPEPADRMYNNHAAWDLRVESPVIDVSVYPACITDTSSTNCQGRIFPGQPWDVEFVVYNRGEQRLTDWTYDADIVREDTGERIPLFAGVAGDSVPVGQSITIRRPSSYVFDQTQDGAHWRLEVAVATPGEPNDRLGDNLTTYSFVVQSPTPDLAINFKCITDSLGIGCLTRLLPGQPWSVSFAVFNQGERGVQDWSYDITLVATATGERIPLKSGIHGGPLPAGGYAQLRWVSYYLFDPSQADSGYYQVEVSVSVNDPLGPEPPDRLGNNRVACSVRVENPVDDIAVVYECITDSTPYNCTNRLFPGQPWFVNATVQNRGDFPIAAGGTDPHDPRILVGWTYDIDLINPDTGGRIPLATRVPGDSIPVGGYAFIRRPSTAVFDESQKNTDWRVEVHAAIWNVDHPEPPGRQSDNSYSIGLRVESPISDIGAAFKCVTDTNGSCLGRVFPGQPWNVAFDAYNSGDTPLDHWSYEVDLVNQDNGDRIPLRTGVPGPPIPRSGSVHVAWASGHVFEESQKGSRWRLDLSLAVTDSLHPEPPGRQNNNSASWGFEVATPVSDIAAYFKCTSDSVYGCRSRVFPGQRWFVSLYVANAGDRLLTNWSYDIDLIQTSTGARTPLVTQAGGDSLPPGNGVEIHWASTYLFDEAQVESDWRVEGRVSIEDPNDPEPADRLGNNQTAWDFRVVDPVPDLGVGFKCVTDSTPYNCLYQVSPGQPWYVFFGAYNSGETPLGQWSYSVDLIDLDTGDRTSLIGRARGDSLPVGGSVQVKWSSPHLFSEADLGSHWRVELTLASEDPTSPEPADRLFNNQSTLDFRIERPIGPGLQIQSLCATDSTQRCVPSMSVRRPWHVLFTVVNPGPYAANWKFDVDLLRLSDSTSISVAHGIPGPRLGSAVQTTIHWPSSYPFQSTDGGKWALSLSVFPVDSAGSDSGSVRTVRTVSLLVDTPTATELALFEARPAGDGLEIRWRFSDPGEIAAVKVERSDATAGPWTSIAATPVETGGVWTVADHAVEPGRSYWYRLAATSSGGERLVFGPVSGAIEAAGTFALSAVTPNPSRGESRVRFTLPRAAVVRLSVIDVQGREVAVLADGLETAGEHAATWNGRTARGDAPAGLYFVRYRTPEGMLVRRLVVTR